MNRKTEKIITWIANSLSLLYFLMMLVSFIALRNNQSSVYSTITKELNQTKNSMSPEMLSATIGIYAFLILFASIYACFSIVCFKERKILAIILLAIASMIGLVSFNLVAAVLWLIVLFMLAFKQDKKTTQSVNDEYIYTK
ncbi:DUF4064 domain-containing protein [Staphylococcus simiae]|uniref:DUF4064 domain-containing protein n=1 Tax=Staphylococcus simiae TaxID=308354 RepID=UPI001A9663D8|nr:DUF4064 domain-containing protein [Staphylococcus simiae]MBO1198626.1 DUF4064 domain-containing protein [Staphylococcus simiae]MBO1200762.1 DUF4064 domain-containing protein [Staphylococcus simiae]MBO1202970.1 DUF4064 domain-containing protein [Staphylococcus simiae]MBO1210679.1 DUF4064 domain-containing protein [Staphylococcus simiae]MBO1229098.1 DUF4064 domain-containing protein [Staphylococcus simiae]